MGTSATIVGFSTSTAGAAGAAAAGGEADGGALERGAGRAAGLLPAAEHSAAA